MRKATLACIALLLALPAQAQPKPQVFSRFSQWASSRMAGQPQTKSVAIDSLRARGADTRGGAYIARSMSDGPAGVKESLQLAATPSTPITDEAGVSYQGVHVAIVGADRAGAVTDLRPLKAGFRTGERFKLRAVSTFAALLVIDNINARGERRQIYPAEGSAVVVLQPGADTLLPLGEKEFFEFARATGEEQLVVSLRDPRASGDAASRQQVYRVDEDFGSFFVQEVADGTFPAIAEPIRLEHR